MSHVPESLQQYVCENCQVMHAGTPVHISGAEHDFEPPEECGACGGTEFIAPTEWVHHHE